MRALVGVGLVVVLLAGCTTTPSQSASSSPSVSSSPATAVPATSCVVSAQEGRLLSDRLVGVSLHSSADAERVEFLFGPRSSAPTQPTGHLTVVQPPFTMGGSGLPVEVKGDRFVQIRFEGMWLYDESGTPTYAGSRDLVAEAFSTIAQVVLVDESEGYSTWIIGFRGNGCVSLEAPSADELNIAFGP